MPRWIQDSETGKLIPAEEYHAQDNDAPLIQGDIEPFVSPVDGSVISSRSQLRRHNAQHGVTDSRDYSPEFLAKRSKERDDALTGNTPQAKKERIEALKHAADQHNYHR